MLSFIFSSTILLKFILNAQRGNVSILSLYHTQNTTQISPIENTKFPSYLICFMFGFIWTESGFLIWDNIQEWNRTPV